MTSFRFGTGTSPAPGARFFRKMSASRRIAPTNCDGRCRSCTRCGRGWQRQYLPGTSWFAATPMAKATAATERCIPTRSRIAATPRSIIPMMPGIQIGAARRYSSTARRPTSSPRSIPSQTDRLVIFRGNYPHVARGVSRTCPALRITLMFKTELIDG
jgi:hypothetical protein